MRVSDKTSRRFPRVVKTVCEALEDRQLMSLTVEVRATDGSASTTVTAVGQTVHLQALAVISSSNNITSQDGLFGLFGSFVSTANGAHSVAGNLSAQNVSPFDDAVATPGKQQDLNGDGNLDAGSNQPQTTDSSYFSASSTTPVTSTDGTVVGNTLVFEIATINYTVTNLNSGGQTSINFVPWIDLNGRGNALWYENNNAVDQANGGVFQAGTPFTLSNPALVTAPTAVNTSATVAINTPTTINELLKDDVIDPLNPASVTVTTAAAHGTTQLQASGSVLYTPAAGYTGTDSFTYTVADINGRISNPATVNINVVATPAPIAANVAVSDYLDQPLNVNVLAQASSTAMLVAGSVLVTSTPGNGTAVVQSDGSIKYTPSIGFTGTDTFSYIVGDSNNESSSAATVTVTVNRPSGPVALDDNFNVITSVPLTLDVLANDDRGSIMTGLTLRISVTPADGTAVLQPDLSILYTPNSGFIGSDTFKYVITDAAGEASDTATVSLNVTATPPPSAANFNAPVLSGQTGAINVLPNVTGYGVPLDPTSVKVPTAPTNGSATANADGSISYVPTAGFIGSDSFTYTIADTTGTVSTPATVTVNVGTSISNAKGSVHSIKFTDKAGGAETISLNVGNAMVFFSGTGSLTVAKNGKGTITSTGLDVTGITLSNTTRASSLSIKGLAKAPVNIGGITGSSLGGISALSANITGDINLAGLGSLAVGNITGSVITIGAALPGKFALTSAAVSGSSLTSSVPVTALKSLSWSGAGSISAPSIASITIKTDGLASNISTGTLGALSVGGSLTGNITATAVKSIRVTGDINGSIINIGVNSAAANLGSLTAASITNSSILAGVAGLTGPLTPTAAPLGTIGSIKLTGRSGSQFSNSNILASKITSLSLGTIATSNGGTRFGVDANSLSSFSGIFGTTPLKLNRIQLKSTAALQAVLTQKGTSLGDFAIVLGS